MIIKMNVIKMPFKPCLRRFQNGTAAGSFTVSDSDCPMRVCSRLSSSLYSSRGTLSASAVMHRLSPFKLAVTRKPPELPV